jgi:hypothetical protein
MKWHSLIRARWVKTERLKGVPEGLEVTTNPLGYTFGWRSASRDYQAHGWWVITVKVKL